jgi:ribose 5-phosphate isomerase B
MRPVITSSDLDGIPAGGELEIAPNAMVTALAREDAERRGIKFVIVEEGKGHGRQEESVARAVAAIPFLKYGKRGIVAVAADHRGFQMKSQLVLLLRDWGYEVLDLGTNGTAAVDYPDFAAAAAEAVASGKVWRGIVIDAAGIGSAIAANKIPGARAAHCNDRGTARSSREHNDANVLTLGANIISLEEAREIMAVWLETKFAGGRHAERVAKIGEIEKKQRR